MRNRHWLPAAVAVIVISSGCAGSAPGLVPQGGAPAHPVAVRGEIAIRVPLRIDSKRPGFVSPSVRSATIAIDPASGCGACTPKFSKDVALTVRSTACAQSPGGTTCKLSIALKPGNYTGTLTTYDGVAGCETAQSPCAALSLDQKFPIQVASGKVKVSTIVLDGVPHALTYSIIDAAIVADLGFNNVGIIGAGARGRIALNAYDADDNLILGPGMPKFSATAGGGFSADVKGNIALLQAPASIKGGFWPLTLSAQGAGCQAAGAQCSTKAYVQFDPIVAVAQQGSSSIVLLPSHSSYPQPYGTIKTGVDKPVAAAFDSSGSLFVLDGGSKRVEKYAQPWTHGPSAAYGAGALTAPTAIALSSGNDIAVLDAGDKSVEIYSPPNSAKISYAVTPSAIAFDSSKNLWVATPGVVRRYAPPYTAAATLTMNTGIGSVTGIGFDSKKEAYFADAGNDAVEAFLPPYAAAADKTFPDIGVASILVFGEVVVACGNGPIYILDTGSLVNVVTIPINDATVQTCARDEKGAVYDVDAKYGQVSQYYFPAYVYEGALIEGADQPSAMAAFP